jgi:hypothetical protein
VLRAATGGTSSRGRVSPDVLDRIARALAGAERRAKVLPGQRRWATTRRCHLLWSLVDGCLAAVSKNESRVVATGFFGAFGFFNSRLPRFRPLAMTVSYPQTRIIEKLTCGEAAPDHTQCRALPSRAAKQQLATRNQPYRTTGTLVGLAALSGTQLS